MKNKKYKKIDMHELYMFTKDVCFPKREREKYSTLNKSTKTI